MGNVIVASKEKKEMSIFDSFYAFSCLPLIKSSYPKEKISLAVPIQIYYFFRKFKNLDKVIVNTYNHSKPSWIDFPIQIFGKFQNDEIFTRDYYSYLLQKPETDFNIFETGEDFFFQKRLDKIYKLINYDKTESVMCVNYLGLELKDNYARFNISFKPVIDPYLNEKDQCVISLWDLFNLVNKFNIYIGDRKIGQFFSSLSNNKKILLGEGDDINSNQRYYRLTRKFLGIDAYDVKYADVLTEETIQGILYDI